MEFSLQSAPVSMRHAGLRKYIYYSTLICMFGTMLFVQVPFHVNVFDVVMLTNFILMFVLVDYTRIPAWIPCILLYLAASGCVGMANHTDSFALFIKEFLGISANLLYFYYFFRLIRNDFERAFWTYARLAFWFVILGIPFWIYLCIKFDSFLRMRGLASEPAQLCVLILPAYYWYAYQFLTTRKGLTQVVVFSVIVILSGSSLGYICVAFGVILLFSARLKYLLAVPVVVGALLYLAYSTSGNFQTRMDDTMLAASTANLTDTNLSTYALLSNAFVTRQVMAESPILGNGLGSHPLSHDRYIGSIPGVVQFIRHGWEDFNASDAASLTLRCLSELGIVGFLGVLIFLFYFHVSGGSPRAAISNAILTCFFLRLVRVGLYFPPEFFFFNFIYILNHRKFKREAIAIVAQDSLAG